MNTLINTLLNDLAYTFPASSHSPRATSCVKDTGDVYTSEIELAGFTRVCNQYPESANMPERDCTKLGHNETRYDTSMVDLNVVHN